VPQAPERTFAEHPSHLGVQRIGWELLGDDGSAAIPFQLLKEFHGELIPNGDQGDMRSARFADVIYEIDDTIQAQTRDNERLESGGGADGYILTNRDDDLLLETSDSARCWNTDARVGTPWQGTGSAHGALNAPLNAHARTPDGPYQVKITAFDEGGAKGEATQDIVLDNFAAYVSRVVVKQAGRVVYDASYDEVTGSTRSSLTPKIAANEVADASAPLYLEITFSEDLHEPPTVGVGASSGEPKEVTLSALGPEERRVFISDAFLTTDELASGRFVDPKGTLLTINGKERFSERELDSDPKTVARHKLVDGLTEFDALELGPDVNHRIKLSATAPRVPVLGSHW
jgi:hypothetical protein